MQKQKKITIRLSDDDYRRAKILVAERGITLSDFFHDAVAKAETEIISPDYEAYLNSRKDELNEAIMHDDASLVSSADEFLQTIKQP